MATLKGDRDAYAELVRRHQANVRGLCLSLLLQPEEGEDAAQDVFVKAYTSLKKFRKDAAFSTWLYRITVNHCQDILRRRSRTKTDSLDALMEGREDFAGPAEKSGSAALEGADWLQRLLAELSQEYREVLTLREAQGLSYKEIAEVLNCSLDAVKARLKRARAEVCEKGRHFLRLENV